MDSTPRFLNDKEVSAMTSIPVQTLRNWRHQGRGFPYMKSGKLVRYRLSDIVEHLEKNKIEPETLNS